MRQSPPFDADAARRLRQALGMTEAQVADGMAASYGVRVGPETVRAWEHRDGTPGSAELTALAGALWCDPSELIGTPRTLREHRLATGLPQPDVAMRLGMPFTEYERVERTGLWTGTERQAAVLAELLRLPPRARIALTGREAELAGLLRSAASVRWQAYVRPVHRMLPSLTKRRVERVLERLHDEYHRRSFVSLSWIDTNSETARGPADAGHRYLDGIEAHFWELIDRT
ncbi:helix-turn-helix transcriptional regulator [Streptomyces sp. XM4193]|uniref:helix-turn-helix domain-containing protein n=1 Tax=Streptomyces sp. XM4193 TaxID=2929782 RepID=UPI001FFAD9E7|nr:helix-turn-helix transcriptional regulator [Streptomyces sp. XM4193]MCK1797549.1 helix-turn-helix transcriptional regulator [Streptomyces sp. XM4193]